MYIYVWVYICMTFNSWIVTNYSCQWNLVKWVKNDKSKYARIKVVTVYILEKEMIVNLH